MSPRSKGLVIGVAAVDAGLRAWALRDLGSRSKDEVNGPKALWSGGLAMISSAGLFPLFYLIKGRRPRATEDQVPGVEP
ncbi:hypothetical protein GOARA_011_00640 [Gordonia araii NBRC 100433]|uniref:DUF5652 domain-containing protein n=2 Tax=Gordonia araii TaxID=263909 RepID=G7GXX3_9ACTN|nr:hypothetical protein GOARA_011_00640 [Gordonia araii NBRC 100433]